MGAEWIDGGTAAGDFRFEIGRDLICTADSNGYFTSLNDAWERTLGWTREELMARPFIEFVHPHDLDRTIREAQKVEQADYEVADFENRYRIKDGGWRWLRWNARSDGDTWFAVAFDISEAKQAEESLRLALTEDRLLAYSQPISDQRSGRIVQEELLVRLRSVGAGGQVIMPSEFLPQAERYGLIGLVDRWMTAKGVALANRGRSAEVNLSARSITDEELIADLAAQMGAAGATAGNLIFEITETAAVENIDAARDLVERMVGLGCRFALDDFGTGFGSLSYLRHLPVEFLKIDTSFIVDVTRSAQDQAMVRSIVAIAAEFGARTVAEGVEDEATLRLLGDYGVDHAQGYFIGRPAPLTSTR